MEFSFPQELKSCNEKLLSLSNERQQLEPRLQRVSQLQVEVDSLAKRCHQLKELHQQQRTKVASLQCQSQQGWEWKVQSAALLREKEDSARRTHGLQQALGACQARLRELEKEGSIKELEVQKLHLQLEQERERAWCKMKVKIEASEYNTYTCLWLFIHVVPKLGIVLQIAFPPRLWKESMVQ